MTKQQKPTDWIAARHALNPYCHWCGIETYITREAHKQAQPDDKATIDHLHHQFDEERLTAQGKTRKVLSCKKCNHARGERRVADDPARQRAEVQHGHTVREITREMKKATRRWPRIVDKATLAEQQAINAADNSGTHDNALRIKQLGLVQP